MIWSHTVFIIFSKLSAKSNSSILGLPFDKVGQIRSSFAKFKLQFRPSFPIAALYQIISNTTFVKSTLLLKFEFDCSITEFISKSYTYNIWYIWSVWFRKKKVMIASELVFFLSGNFGKIRDPQMIVMICRMRCKKQI